MKWLRIQGAARFDAGRAAFFPEVPIGGIREIDAVRIVEC